MFGDQSHSNRLRNPVFDLGQFFWWPSLAITICFIDSCRALKCERLFLRPFLLARN